MDLLWIRRLTRRTAIAPAPHALGMAVLQERACGAVPGPQATLSLRAPQAILEAHTGLIARLRLHAACDEAQFALRFIGPLLRLARHVNVLPATAQGLFRGDMGLFRACLQAAFFSFQASDGHIFTGSEGVERRHALEGRWRYVCFLAALFHPLGRPLERIVLAQVDAEDWQQQLGGITAWAERAGVDRLAITWSGVEDREAIGPSPATLPLLPAVVGRENLHMLDEGAPELVAALCQLAAGASGPFAIVQQTVTGCWQRICAREAAQPSLWLATRASADAHETDAPTVPLAQPAPAQEEPAPVAALATAPQEGYAGLVPPDLRQEIAARLHAEALGRIVHDWRERREGSTVMRRIEAGAAIEFTYLTTTVANVPIWLDAMARCGLVHAPAHAPGLRIQKVAMADGQPPVQALVLSNLACRRLGL